MCQQSLWVGGGSKGTLKGDDDGDDGDDGHIQNDDDDDVIL